MQAIGAFSQSGNAVQFNSVVNEWMNDNSQHNYTKWIIFNNLSILAGNPSSGW
jgi:hypothetical protein